MFTGKSLALHYRHFPKLKRNKGMMRSDSLGKLLQSTPVNSMTRESELSLKADSLSLQKPLAASYQVLASSQDNFLSLHEYEHSPGWSFKQRQLNQAITITLQLTEHADIFLYQQCFTTTTIRSSSHFEQLELTTTVFVF